MFNLPEISAAVIAIVLIALICIYGFFHVTIGGLAVMALVLVIGALIGVGLGRRSKTANAVYDRAVAEAEHLRARTAEIRKSAGLD